MNEGLKVLKRDNKKVDFNGEKIAIAIKKSFDSRDDFIERYTDEDINKVYRSVLNDIFDNYFEKPYIKVEEIQDIIEKQLLKLEYNDIYESFSNYRDKRSESRRMFLSEPKQHKLLKAIEKITLKQDWIKKNNDSQIDVIFNYGKTISEEFASAYFISNKFYSLHESGQIYIENMEHIPTGTTDSFIIPFNKLLEKGFYIGDNYYKPPTDIMSCMTLMPLIVRKSLEDVSGEIGLPNFDSYLSIFVLKTFKEELKSKIFDFLELDGFLNFVDHESIFKEINKLETIDFDFDLLNKYSKDVEQIKTLLYKAYEKAIVSTKELVYKSIFNFLHCSYFKVGDKLRDITINIGTDTKLEGRIITEAYLKALDKDVSIHTVFKLKDGINFNPKDINHDLFTLALNNEQNNIAFSYLDSTFNKNELEDVFYFEDGVRILENYNSEDNSPIGRGILSKTYINLPRIAIKIKLEERPKEEVFSDIESILDLVKEQLVERFDIQSNKKANDFPFIIGENLYMDSKGIKPLEKIKKAIKNGVLGIGIVGLNEFVKEMNLNKEDVLKVITDKINSIIKETKLNFVLIGPKKEVSEVFIDLDRAIYGDIKGLTDKEHYDLDYIEDNIQESFLGGYVIKTNKASIEDIKHYKIKNYGYIKKEVNIE